MSLSEKEAQRVVNEAAFKSGERRGQRYFFVEDNGGVVASASRESLDIYISDPNRVRLSEERGGWRWVQEVLPGIPLEPRTERENAVLENKFEQHRSDENQILKVRNDLLALVAQLDTYLKL